MRRNIKGITAVGMTLMMTGALFGCGTADQKADAAETGTEIITEATSEATTEAASETEATTEATTEAATEAASEAATEATDKPEADDSAADEEGKEGMRSKDGVEKGMIEIIGQDRAMWESQGDDAYYTVTDLDHNDRAEIIVATSGGTGHFTYAKIYEVDSTYDGLVACDDGLDEGVPFPDFVIDGNFLTFKDGDKYFYVCSDVYNVLCIFACRPASINAGSILLRLSDAIANAGTIASKVFFADSIAVVTVSPIAFQLTAVAASIKSINPGCSASFLANSFHTNLRSSCGSWSIWPIDKPI